MKYAGMPMGMWVLMKELGLYDLTPALCHLDYTMSEAGGVTDFVRQYTLASGGPSRFRFCIGPMPTALRRPWR